MSYSISGKIVSLTRGDSFSTPIELVNEDGTPYEMQDGDSLRFKCTDVPGGAVLIEKAIPSDTLLLQLDPSDTNVLPFGNYFFDIELTYANGKVETVIPEGQFNITAEADAIRLNVFAPNGGT